VPFAFRLGNTQMAERARHDIAGVIIHLNLGHQRTYSDPG
jgi:hypothetical protein